MQSNEAFYELPGIKKERLTDMFDRESRMQGSSLSRVGNPQQGGWYHLEVNPLHWQLKGVRIDIKYSQGPTSSVIRMVCRREDYFQSAERLLENIFNVELNEIEKIVQNA